MPEPYRTNLETYWLTRVYTTNGTSFTFFQAVYALGWMDAVFCTRKGETIDLQVLEDRTTWKENHEGQIRECRLWKQTDRPPCKTQSRFSVKDDRMIRRLPKKLNFGQQELRL
jgi:hypothetical protein